MTPGRTESRLADPAHKTERNQVHTVHAARVPPAHWLLARCELLLGALVCAALRCAALSLSIIGFGFSHSSILRSGPEPPHLPSLPLSPRPAALSSPPCARRSWFLPTVSSQSWLSACSSSKPPSFRSCLPRTRISTPLPPTTKLDLTFPPLYSTIAFVLTVPAKLQNGQPPPSTLYPSYSRHTRLPVFHWRG